MVSDVVQIGTSLYLVICLLAFLGTFGLVMGVRLSVKVLGHLTAR